MESILTSIKKALGIVKECTDFDNEIILHINSVFGDLAQIGVGPSNGFYIEDATAVWEDFIEDNLTLQAVRSYMTLRVKLLFDPGSVGPSTLTAYESQIAQWEWRLSVAAETNKTT